VIASNCTFQPVRTLPGNIGYLKFDTFTDPTLCASTAASAMDALNSSSAVILDLRDNCGGSPQMVMFLAAYFFDHPVFFWNPREDNESRMWTRSPASRSRLASTPLFVLTSSRTYSAAEHFTYNLKMLHRAVIVGETTSGATDVGVFHRIDAHFGIGLSESRVRNPYSTPDWAVTGVSPDIAVPADQALQAAQQRAVQLLAHR
jgi:C-terminal processing protease CtpA/Prc